jgi:hypothetical protein
VKLRGRPEAPIKRGRMLSPRAGGAHPPTVHGPLQRSLDGMAEVLHRSAITKRFLKRREPARIVPHAAVLRQPDESPGGCGSKPIGTVGNTCV